MLVVYLNLFGAGFMPLAKPLVTLITTLSIIGAWWWMNKRAKAVAANQHLEANVCHPDNCQCKEPFFPAREDKAEARGLKEFKLVLTFLPER